jgi:transforming growth factor-beta-induced protein
MNTMRRSLLCLAAVMALSGATGVHAGGYDMGHHMKKMTDCQTVVQVAVENNFTVLAAALDAANLIDTFNDTDLMVTVFAPTDEAFNNAIAALNTTAEDLLANTELLTAVLQLHVVPAPLGLVTWEVPTLNPNATLTIAPFAIAGTTAQISTPGVRACRSVVYPIDTVLLPEA